MSVTALPAFSGTPVADGQFIACPASGTALEINPGDYVCWSANYIIAANTGVASWKASGIGIALDRNPAMDNAGRQVINSAVMVARWGTFRVSANFSGKPLYGVVAAPVATGSGVNGVSGNTGVGSLWNTAAPAPTVPQAITYDYKDLASAISAYVTYSASGSALLPASGLLAAKAVSASVAGVATVINFYDSGPLGTGQLDIVLWDRNADTY
jgi:hypothetical protein